MSAVVQLTSVYSGLQIVAGAEWSEEEAQEWARQIVRPGPRTPDADMADAELAGAIGLSAVDVRLVELDEPEPEPHDDH